MILKYRFGGTASDSFRLLILDISSYLFLALYVYTAYEKLKNHQLFENTISHSILIGRYSAAISWLVPIVELMISLLLILPNTRIWGLKAGVALMALFTAYLGYMLLFAEKLSCSCGGFVSELSWQDHLLFNSLFILIGLAALLFQQKNLQVFHQ